MATQKQEEETVIGLDTLCRLLTLSRERIDQLVRQGFIERRGRNQYALVASVQGYIRFLREAGKNATKTAADTRVRDARAKDLEVKTLQRLGRLVPIDVYQETIDNLCGTIRSEFAGLAAASTRDLTMRRIIEREVNVRLKRIAESAMVEAIRIEKDSGAPHAERAH
jgi:hypothetical protein